MPDNKAYLDSSVKGQMTSTHSDLQVVGTRADSSEA
jgi:hypothetical protein